MKQVKITTTATVINTGAQTTQHMTSLEIAELTGKQHKNVMQAIRNMEPAWEKTCGLKFQLTSRTIIQPNGGTRKVPCYQLTKTECLYIATKFNDEARARLVIRWQELEEKLRCQMVHQKNQLLLESCDEKILDEADNIIGEELQELNKHCAHCYTPSEIAKVYGLESRDLNSFLRDMGIIRWTNGQWMPTAKYRNQGLTETKSFIYYDYKGNRKMQTRLMWTKKGKEFIDSIIG
jgi:phage regulator Rha-like protein